MILLLLSALPLPSQDPPRPLPRIGIRSAGGRAFFVRGDDPAPFVPKGFNYIRLRDGDHATFDADTETTKAHYDPERAESMFRILQSTGANTVRVFITGRTRGNPGIAGNPAATKGVYEPYMDHVADFLRRAARRGIYVLPTFGDGELPINRHYQDRLPPASQAKNAIYLTAEGIAAKKAYVTDFLRALRDRVPTLLTALLGIQCQNELYLAADRWPFTQREGTLRLPNGKAYDMASPRDRRLLMEEGLRHYHDELIRSIKAVDPALLVSEGIFTRRAVGRTSPLHEEIRPETPGDKRHPPTLPVLGRSSLDFLDVHYYPVRQGADLAEDFRTDLASSLLGSPEMAEVRAKKPLLLGEFGAFRHIQKDPDEMERQMLAVRDLALAEGFAGWLYWTFDCHEQKPLWNAMDLGEDFIRRLAGPAQR